RTNTATTSSPPSQAASSAGWSDSRRSRRNHRIEVVTPATVLSITESTPPLVMHQPVAVGCGHDGAGVVARRGLLLGPGAVDRVLRAGARLQPAVHDGAVRPGDD